MSKYFNKKIIIDGFTFDSQKEGNYYLKLKMLQKSGIINDLKLQVPFELLPTTRVDEQVFRKKTYKADFTYITTKDDKLHVVDVKGFKTDVYMLKKHMMAERYGIKIEEV